MSAGRETRSGGADQLDRSGRAPQMRGAVARSPFPPIASFAFLSDCHTGALVAPDGAVAWLCPPRFDAPSVFATILDRQAGYFRFGPFDVNAPSARNYEPGTNVLVTTWKTPTGWAEVRDALTILPRSEPDTTTPHTRAPGDDDAGHCLVRTVTCLDGHVELGREGTFLICSFWLVSALTIIGEGARAKALMEKLLHIVSPLGLLAEELDTDTGQHLGNFPQAFSHLALIEAARRIIMIERLLEFV